MSPTSPPAVTGAPQSIVLPAPPAPSSRRSFPLLATVAPVLASGVLWAVTQSPFALMFALLGPVIALASLGDSAVQTRRQRRAEQRRFEADARRVAEAIAAGHAVERAALQREFPGVGAVLEARTRDPTRFRGVPENPLTVVLGSGVQPSTLRVDGGTGFFSDGAAELACSRLRDQAARLEAAPVVVDVRLGIGIIGPPGISRPVARSIAIQLAHALAPADSEWQYDPGSWNWIRGLPHPSHPAELPAGTLRVLQRRSGTVLAVIAVAAVAEQLPDECALVLSMARGALGVLLDPSVGSPETVIRPSCITVWQARAAAARLVGFAGGQGSALADALPTVVELSSVLATGASGGTLHCAIGQDAQGAVQLDLVGDGPHALVTGTTGSGKSELLISWILSMAYGRSVRSVTFLLIDFKGGSAFTPLAGLPHCVGVITDLDGDGARRALESLRAELRFRERHLAHVGRRSIDDDPADDPSDEALARLVIVVDEYAAMTAEFPELAEVFSDIAARGRSLGMHLLLCTQRATGVVRDSVFANAALRISLRVTNRADSLAVVDVPDAAELPAQPPGRAVLSTPGRAARTVQLARSGPSDLARIIAQTPPAPPPRRPWCDPLPSNIPLADLRHTGAGIAFGMVDLPQEQRQHAAVYDPHRHGHLFVAGGQRSGKSTLLSVLATHPSAQRVAPGVEAAWDAAEAAARRRVTGSLLLFDDLDDVCSRLDDDYRHQFIELLARAARDPAGVRLVIAAQRVTTAVQALLPLFEARLLLRMTDRQEHLVAGGIAASFQPMLPPGGGHWCGDRVQTAYLAPQPPPRPLATGAFEPRTDRHYVVAAADPAESAAAFRRIGSHTVIELSATSADPRQLTVVAGERPRILVADPDAWHSWWGALAALRANADLIIDRCPASEFRQLTRDRALPPPFEPGDPTAWLIERGGRPSRIRIGDSAD